MDPLRTHRVILCERLDVGKVIPYLRQDRMLTADEYDTLTNTIYSVKARRNKLLDMMPRKGRNYFEHFGKNLVWSGQKELAKHIGVNVDKVPQPPPYKLEPELDPVDTYKQFLGLIGNSGSPNVFNAHPYNPNFPAGVAAPPMQGTAAGYPPAPPMQGTAAGYPPAPPMQGTAAGYPPAPPMQGTAAGYPPAPPMQGSAAGHLPSHGVLPLPNPQLQPLEPLPQEAPALPPILGDSKVFILYCKDDSIPNVEADHWSQTVFNLADLLGQCGRIKCTIDYYEKQAQGNWDAWTVKRIKESNFVVLVMSPLMARGLCHPSHQSLPMEIGLFYLDSISALATSPHFVPVFLDDCIPPSRNLRDWLPPRLTMGSVLHLQNFSAFVNGYTENSGGSEEEESTRFYRYIQESLQDPRFASVTSLIRHLRGEHESPPQPVASVTLPRSQPQASHVEFPYVVEAEYISHEDLDKIASKVHREWQHLGIKLGLTVTDGLRDIHYKYRSDPVKATRAMLHTWQKVKKKEATRRALKKALLEQNMGRLANELFPDVLI